MDVRFIVRTRSGDGNLNDFVNEARSDHALELVDTIGPSGRPHTAIVAVHPEAIAAFERRYSHSPHLMIERDRPLSLFAGPAHGGAGSERNKNA